MVCELKGKPLDFSFTDIAQYGTAAQVKRIERFSLLLDSFYFERDRADRMKNKSHDLLKLLANASDRLSRKINTQQAELQRCSDREPLRVCGDLIQANLYRIEKGAPFADLENFYEENSPVLRVKLNPALSASQNAQRYYKEYRKAKTAEQVLAVQIEKRRKSLRILKPYSTRFPAHIQSASCRKSGRSLWNRDMSKRRAANKNACRPTAAQLYVERRLYHTRRAQQPPKRQAHA